MDIVYAGISFNNGAATNNCTWTNRLQVFEKCSGMTPASIRMSKQLSSNKPSPAIGDIMTM